MKNLKALIKKIRGGGDRKFGENEHFVFIYRTIIQSEPAFLEVDAPICICGDIHGQFTDLLRIFDLVGKLPNQVRPF